MPYRDDRGRPRYRLGYAAAAYILGAVAVTYLGQVWWDRGLIRLLIYLACVTPLIINAWRKRIKRGETMAQSRPKLPH